MGIMDDWVDWVDGRKREGREAGWVRRRNGVYGCGGGPWTCELSDQKANSNEQQRHAESSIPGNDPSKGLVHHSHQFARLERRHSVRFVKPRLADVLWKSHFAAQLYIVPSIAFALH